MVSLFTRFIRQAALTCLVFVATSSFAGQNNGKLARELQNVSDDQSLDVIVQYRVPPHSAHFDRVKNRGGVLKKDLRGAIQGAVFHIPASLLAVLANDPDVAYVTPDRTLSMFAITTDFYDQAVLAPYAWSAGLDGSGIGVAVIDSGVTDAGDFSRG
jgi:serine protease AprX